MRISKAKTQRVGRVASSQTSERGKGAIASVNCEGARDRGVVGLLYP